MADEPGALSKLCMRRHFLVDARLQLGLAVRAGMYTMLVLCVMGVGLFIPLVEALDRGPTTPGIGDSAAAMIYLHENFWLLAGLCLAVVLIAAIAVSHRIAGPMVRFKRHLHTIGAGQLPPRMRTRRDDFMKAEVAALNAMVDELQTRSDEAHAARDRIADELARCCQDAEDAGAAALGARLRESARRLDELGGLLLPRSELALPPLDPAPVTPQSARSDAEAVETSC